MTASTDGRRIGIAAATALLLGLVEPQAARADIVISGETSRTTSLGYVIQNASTETLNLAAPTNADGHGTTTTGNHQYSYVYDPNNGSKIYGNETSIGPNGSYTINPYTRMYFFGALVDTNSGTNQLITFYRAGTALANPISISQQGVVYTGNYVEYLNADVSGGFDKVVISATSGYIYMQEITLSTSTESLTTGLADSVPVPEPAIATLGLTALAAAATCQARRKRLRSDTFAA